MNTGGVQVPSRRHLLLHHGSNSCQLIILEIGTPDCIMNKANDENPTPTEESNNDKLVQKVTITNIEEAEDSNSLEADILDEVKNCAVIFQSQQRGDPELTTTDKRNIAEKLLHEKPVTFLLKFGEFLKEEHLDYFVDKFGSSYEVQYYVKNLKKLLNDHNKKIIKRNRRYEAMKRMEAEGKYFSEVEMEKREPLLYHQMVGQYLSEKEKLLKNREAQQDVIPSFSNFLIHKMEREEMSNLVKSQQEEEDKMQKPGSSSEDEDPRNRSDEPKRWGEDWDEEKSRKKLKKKQSKKPNINITKKEKTLLLQEFQSIMKNNFLNGNDIDFNYSEVDLNPEYDSVDLRTQDEEEKYFDEESYDATVCTDTGIDDY